MKEPQINPTVASWLQHICPHRVTSVLGPDWRTPSAGSRYCSMLRASKAVTASPSEGGEYVSAAVTLAEVIIAPPYGSGHDSGFARF